VNIMKPRWIGISGLAFILAALILGTLGSSLWPRAFWSSQYSGTMGPGMMSGGTMGPGMMSGGMMNGGMMGGGMMNRDQMRSMTGANADFDRMFLQMMIPHHESAIAMAQQALAQAEHPEIKTLAQNIVTTQHAEIAEMRGYCPQRRGGLENTPHAYVLVASYSFARDFE